MSNPVGLDRFLQREYFRFNSDSSLLGTIVTELLYLLPFGICAMGVWLMCIMMPNGEGCKSKHSKRVGTSMLMRLVFSIDMREELRCKSNPTAEVAGWFRLSIGRPLAYLQAVGPSGFIHAKNKNGLRR